jgi:hypothetical protein
MRSLEPPIFERCLQVTASFEGTGFTRVVGNFDGAGITWGIIGFTLVNNELGAVLAVVNSRYPALIGKAFGHDADEIMQITSSTVPKANKLAWANSISRGNHKYNVAEPWETYFSDLGSYREVQLLQIDRAREIYWRIACSDAGALSISEELDYLLMFDVAVQNGGMKSKGRLQKALQKINSAAQLTAWAKREIIAQVVADSIGPKYRSDVLSRKMSIAVGGGKVHGGAYALADWGFLDGYSPTAGIRDDGASGRTGGTIVLRVPARKPRCFRSFVARGRRCF